MLKFILVILLIMINFLVNIPAVKAETLRERIDNYPEWNNKITLPSPQEDLIYPNWFSGQWQVTSKLVEKIAPLAPDLITPGFDNNEQYLNEDIKFQVRFIPTFPILNVNNFLPSLINTNQAEIIIADRKFNSLQITEAYLKDLDKKNDNQLSIKVYFNPNNSTEQITELSPENELVSKIIGRKQEDISDTEFITSELTRQFFRRTFNIYVNLVETDTKYQLINSNKIEADQFTAIYLSPEDPNFFIAKNKPVALYHYLLTLEKNVGVLGY